MRSLKIRFIRLLFLFFSLCSPFCSIKSCNKGWFFIFSWNCMLTHNHHLWLSHIQFWFVWKLMTLISKCMVWYYFKHLWNWYGVDKFLQTWQCATREKKNALYHVLYERLTRSHNILLFLFKYSKASIFSISNLFSSCKNEKKIFLHWMPSMELNKKCSSPTILERIFVWKVVLNEFFFRKVPKFKLTTWIQFRLVRDSPRAHSRSQLNKTTCDACNLKAVGCSRCVFKRKWEIFRHLRQSMRPSAKNVSPFTANRNCKLFESFQKKDLHPHLLLELVLGSFYISV